MNLNDYRTRVARASGMSPSDSGDLALIDDWVNEGVVKFLKDTKMNVAKASMAVTAGSADYTLDTDILAFMDIYISPASGQWDRLLEPIDSADLIRMRLLANSSMTTVQYYSLQGANTLMLYPAPESSSDVLHILYVPRPTALSATSDTPSATANGNIPEEYHDIIESYAKWKACEAEEHKPSEYGLQHQAQYERGITRAKSDMNKKAGVLKAPAKWGRKRRYFARQAGPGVDVKY